MKPSDLGRIPYVVAKRRWTKWKRRKKFNFDEIVSPLLDEVSAAAEGTFPGEPRNRFTEWSEIGKEIRINMPSETVDLADEYERLLDQLETKESKRVNIATQFIGKLPGGKQVDEKIRITVGVKEMRGPTEVPRDGAEPGNFDRWLKDCWPAFEESKSSSDLETRIRGLSKEHDTNFDREGIRYWENSHGMPDWSDTLWHLYDTGNLVAYHSALTELEEIEDRLMTVASDFESELKKLN